ncbi:hypothetical protein Daesc_006257 [Daldinia eschscholtzii]|uniref:Heterokaryon incompatibility domain-containing protein n=1 Tax=Daldinia eschscholtzii TaxID=292717 RepID=A0AAX6MGV6_9PEZI
MSVLNKYQYEPLCAKDGIRLIMLDPASHEGDPLICSIIQRRRSAQTEDYFAVSYTWGKPDFSRMLEIRCDSGSSYLKITPNVDALLRRLRALKVLRCLWIDAICLNQADDTEKAQQIPEMGCIFEQAKLVHIWLGTGDETTADLFTFFNAASQLPEMEKSMMASHIVTITQAFNGGVVRALGSFFEFADRPWFSRRWIIQEACLAQQAIVHCGPCSIPLETIVLAARRFQTLDMSSYPVKVMTNLHKPVKLTILELLWNFHEALCLEPKDRIAALLGLVQDDHRFYLDYTVHWTELYKQVASSYLSYSNNDIKLQVLLHLFEFGCVPQSEANDYPSWVPNWSKTRIRLLPYNSDIRNLDTWEPYPTSPGHSGKASLTFHNGVLQIHWHPLIGGPRSRQIIYAILPNKPQLNKTQKTERVKRALHKLFPASSNQTLRVLAVSSLLKLVITFRHIPPNERKKTSPYDKIIRKTIKKLPESSQTEILDTFRQMNFIMKDYCLFESEPARQNDEANATYGICSQVVQAGDVMIPLWNIKWKGDANSDLLDQTGMAIQMKTMLAVRRIAGKQPQCTTSSPTGKFPNETGRIVGWAVCVLLQHKSSYEQNLSVDAEWDAGLNREQKCSMRLV